MFELTVTILWVSTNLLIVLVNSPAIGRPSGKNNEHLIKAETKNMLINSLTLIQYWKEFPFLNKESQFF